MLFSLSTGAALEQLMIKLELDVKEINGVLTALGNLPYIQVVDLIAKIREQAAPQVAEQETGAQ